MSLKNISGFQSFPLSTGSNDSPAFTPGGPLKFQLSTLPRNLGSLAYYLYGIVVTFAGTLTQSGGTGVPVFDQRMLGLLIDYLSLQNAWHGTPLSANWVKGYWLPTILPVGGGYNEAFPIMPTVPAANGANLFSKSIFIPLCMGNGAKPHHSAQLNVLYRNAYLEIGCQAAAVLTALSPGATFSGVTVKASAICLPEPEIRVGPGVEWVDYQTPASSGQNQVLLDSFGNSTQLINTEAGAAVAFAMAMSNIAGQPGAFSTQFLTQVSVPFRNQIQTTHIEPFIAMQIMSQGARRKLGQGVEMAGTSGQLDNVDFPYAQSTIAVSGVTNLEVVRGLGLPLVSQPTEVQSSKLQVVNGDTSYFMTLSSGPSGTHHTLVQHLRSWTPKAYDEALKVIKDSRLANDVFGNSTDLAWSVKMGNGKNPNDVAPHKLRFLPLALKPKAFAERRQGKA